VSATRDRVLPADAGSDASMSDGVLLTGAAGFVGMELLARFLERTDRRVYALVRGASERDVTARVKHTLLCLFGAAGTSTLNRRQMTHAASPCRTTVARLDSERSRLAHQFGLPDRLTINEPRGTASRREECGDRARPDWPPEALVESVILVHEGFALVG
jgi:Male sterility protein